MFGGGVTYIQLLLHNSGPLLGPSGRFSPNQSPEILFYLLLGEGNRKLGHLICVLLLLLLVVVVIIVRNHHRFSEGMMEEEVVVVVVGAGSSSGPEIPGPGWSLIGIPFVKDGNFELIGGDPQIDHELFANRIDVVRIVK